MRDYNPKKLGAVSCAVLAFVVATFATANCPQPAPAGKCGLATQAASCATKCVSISGGQTDIKNCTGSDANKKCKYNTINWSVALNYYEMNKDASGKCIGCTTKTIVYPPEDPLHPPAVRGTCEDAYVSTEDCPQA